MERFSVKYKNLKLNKNMNAIEHSNANKEFWIPKYQFLGNQNSTSKVEYVIGSLRVRRMSDPLPDNDEYVSTG